MLGVVLLMTRIVLSLDFGWWIQWLLMAVLWWGAFRHRDALWSDTFRHHQQILNLAGAARGGSGGGGRSRIGGMRLTSMMMSGRETTRLAGWAKGKITRPGATAKLRQTRAAVGRGRAKDKADEQVTRSMRHDRRDASRRVTQGEQSRSRLAKGHTQLGRIRAAREQALKAGNKRRAAELDVRAKRVEAETTHAQQQMDTARSLAAGGERMWGVGEHRKAEERQRHSRWLDGQAALPDNAAPTSGGQRRDYPALAGLAGHERSEYERMTPGSQRQARLNIDRELRLRRELNKTTAGGGEPKVEQPQLRGGKQRRAVQHFDRDLKKSLSTDGQKLPPSLQGGSASDRWREEGRRAPKRPERAAQDRAGESQAVRDARARDAARKRQFGRPKQEG